MSNQRLPQRVILRSASLPAPRFRYSPLVQVEPFVFVSGMVALDQATGRLIEGDAYDQTKQILLNLAGLLAEFKWTPEQIVLARLYCADFSQFGAVNRAWEEFFAQDVPPARTSIGVSALPLNAVIEIEFQLLASGAMRLPAEPQ